MSTTIRHDLPAVPKFMADLPIDERGYPVPWFVDWINGKPEFRAMDHRKLIKAINERRCWTCGKPLFGEEVFVIGPMCAINRISGEPPNHRECALFAAMGCPFLSKPQMVRRENDMPAEKLPQAGIGIKRNPGVTLLWYTRSHQLMEVPNGVLFKIGRPFKTEWYRQGRSATRDEVMESINSGLPALREADRSAGVDNVDAEIDRRLAEAMRWIPR
jgi:hypothetical protein